MKDWQKEMIVERFGMLSADLDQKDPMKAKQLRMRFSTEQYITKELLDFGVAGFEVTLIEMREKILRRFEHDIKVAGIIERSKDALEARANIEALESGRLRL